jgi:TRAF3-interacting protein 1
MNAKGGALVEEAKKLMAQGNEEGDNQEDEPESKGPKIKMRTRLGKNKKKPAAGKEEDRNTDAGPARSANIELKPSSGSSMSGQAFSEKDIEFMKKAIQVLCSSTNPLGRSIEFVTDDLDSMTKEFEYWTKESHSCHTRLKEE